MITCLDYLDLNLVYRRISEAITRNYAEALGNGDDRSNIENNNNTEIDPDESEYVYYNKEYQPTGWNNPNLLESTSRSQKNYNLESIAKDLHKRNLWKAVKSITTTNRDR